MNDILIITIAAWAEGAAALATIGWLVHGRRTTAHWRARALAAERALVTARTGGETEA